MPKKWEQSPNNSHEGINLEEVFSNPNLNVAKLLNIQHIVEQCKKQNEIFTHKYRLVLHPSILHDLIQICLRPSYFEHQQLSQITTQHTYKALEILNNLSQQFSQYLLPTSPLEQDENVITQQQMDPDIDFNCPLVTQVLKILHDPKPISQTPLWYMYKINTSICYQKPKQMIKLFKQNKELSMNLFEHFYSNSIVEWLIKLLETEDSNSFFEEDKIAIFKYFIESMSKLDTLQHDIDLKLNKLQNYSVLLNTLLQKMQDRFDKTKFIKLTKGIYSQKYGIDFIVQALYQRVQHQKPCSQSEEQIFKNLLVICEIYIHFGAQYKKGLTNSIKLNWNENQKKVDSSNNSNFGIENENNQIIFIQLSSDVIKNIRENVLSLSVQFHLNHNNLSTIIQFLKLLRTVILTLQPTQHQFVYQIMSPEFIQFLFTQIQKNGKSNILHNLVRDILIESIRVNYQNTVKILLSPDKSTFLSMISHVRGINSQEYQYENQLYHIFQVILKLGQRQEQKQLFSQLKKEFKYEQIEEQIKEKQTLYNSLICQNPRQQTWGDQEQDQKLLLFSFNENKKNGEEEKLLSPNGNDIICGNVQHFVQFGLPLDSDESKDEENYLASSDVLEKQESGQNYKPIIKLTTSGEYERKQSQLGLYQQNQLAKKFKNIGIVQCQQQQIRIQVKKERYGNKSYISNPFIYLNPNANLNFNTVTSPKSSPKNSPKNSITKLLLETKTGMLGQKIYIQKQFQKKPMKLLTKQDEEMQKQIQILQNKEYSTNQKKGQKNKQLQVQIKNKNDFFGEDKKTFINPCSSKQQQIQSKILGNNQSCHSINKSMDQTPPKNTSLSEKNINNSVNLIQIQKQCLLDYKCPIQQSDELEKKNIIVISQQQKEIGNTSDKKNEIDSQEKNEVGLNKKQRKNSPSSKIKSRSSSGKKISFPTYLSYQIDEILAELD